MTKIHKIVDANTAEVIERPYTKEELKDDEFRSKLFEKQLAVEKEHQAQRQAIADRLGLTADELKILLG